MHERLIEEHRLIQAAAGAFLVALRESRRLPNKIHLLRAQLGTQMMRHRASEEEHVLGPFMAAGGFDRLPEVQPPLQAIRDEWLNYSTHVRQWTPRAIEADWDGYADSAERRIDILNRLTRREEQEVYVPILRFLEQSKRATPATKAAS